MKSLAIIMLIATMMMAKISDTGSVLNSVNNSIESIDLKTLALAKEEKNKVMRQILNIKLYSECLKDNSTLVCVALDSKKIVRDIENLSNKKWDKLPFQIKNSLYNALKSLREIKNDTKISFEDIKRYGVKQPYDAEKINKKFEETMAFLYSTPWSTFQKTDPIDDEIRTFFTKESNISKSERRFEKRPTLVIYEVRGTLQIYISNLKRVAKQSEVIMRFDKEKAETVSCFLDVPKDAIFIYDSEKIFHSLLNTSTLIFRYRDYNGTTNTLKFHTKNLENKILEYDGVFSKYITNKTSL
jgi:hypothetical protein